MGLNVPCLYSVLHISTLIKCIYSQHDHVSDDAYSGFCLFVITEMHYNRILGLLLIKEDIETNILCLNYAMILYRNFISLQTSIVHQ